MSVTTELPNSTSFVKPTVAVKPARSSVSSVLWYALPVICGFAVRYAVAVVWLASAEPHNDAADYFSEASKISDGTREAVPFYWPPGNSYYIAACFSLFGSSFAVARLATVVLSTLQIVVVGLLTQYATNSRRMAMTASWIWALYPPSVFLVGQPYSQHLSGLSLAAIALLGIYWIKNRSLFAAVLLGLCVGVGCLTRPSMMSVAGITGLCILFVCLNQTTTWRNRLWNAGLQSLLYGFAVIAVLAPTLLHNARTGGGYTLSTNNERNFFLGNNPYTPWYKTSHFAQRSLDELSPEVKSYLESVYALPNRRAEMKRIAMDHIRQNPGVAALRTFNRARSFWGFDYLASRVILATTGSKLMSAAVLLAEAAGYCAVMLLAIFAILNWRGHIQGEALTWYLAVALAYMAPYCLAFASGTYHFPVIGPIVTLAAVGIHLLYSGEAKRMLRSRLLWCAAVLFIAIQLEYAYFTLAAGTTKIAGSSSSIPKIIQTP